MLAGALVVAGIHQSFPAQFWPPPPTSRDNTGRKALFQLSRRKKNHRTANISKDAEFLFAWCFTMVLEEQRFIHEDLERLEHAIADRVVAEPRNVSRMCCLLLSRIVLSDSSLLWF